MSHRVKSLVTKYTRTADHGGLIVGVGGYSAVFHEVGTTIEHDLVRAESLALPITLILLLLVFGTRRVVLAAAGHRRAVGGRHVRRAPAPQHGHRGLDLQPQPDHRDGPRAWPSTTRCSWCRGTGRSCGPATSPTWPWPAPCAPPAAPSPSAPSRWPRRCARCSCSPWPSCAASPTPAWPWPSSPACSPSWCSRRMLAALGPQGRRAHDLQALDARRTTRASGTAWRSS